jgi:hypothetical protein
VSIWGLHWPWRTKKGRTFERYDKRGRLRIFCANSESPVTGEIEVEISDSGRHMPGGGWEPRQIKFRWTLCPECNRNARVAGLKSKPRLSLHNAEYHTR